LFEALDDALLFVVLEFSIIKKGTETSGTGFVLDVDLVFVDHGQHLHITVRAVDFPYVIIFLASLFIANINVLGSASVLEIFFFKFIEPKSLTVDAPVYLNIFVGYGGELRFAFRTLHHVLPGHP
jgi:hypothetical protein